MYSLTAESSLPLLILGVLHLLERDDTNAYFVTIIAVRNRWRYFSPDSVTTVCFRFENTKHFRLNVYVFIVFGWFSFLCHSASRNEEAPFFGGRGGGSLIQSIAFGGPSQGNFLAMKVSISAVIALNKAG